MKNITLLNPSRKEEIENSEFLLKRHGSIIVKFLRENEHEVFLYVEQNRNHAGNYKSGKELADIVKNNFGCYTDKKIHVRAKEYNVSPPEIVDADWIKNSMAKYNVRSKQIIEDTGIDKTDLSSHINNHKPIGQRSKAMYYYYFKSLES